MGGAGKGKSPGDEVDLVAQTLTGWTEKALQGLSQSVVKSFDIDDETRVTLALELTCLA